MYPEEVVSLLVSCEKTLTADYIQDLLKVYYSPHGSNLKVQEDKIVYNWMTYIQESAGEDDTCNCLMLGAGF